MKLVCWMEQERRCVGLVRNDVVHKIIGVEDIHALIVQNKQCVDDSEIEQESIPLASLTPVSPLNARRNLLCVGWNYQLHFDEGAHNRSQSVVKDLPARPTFFSKSTCTVNDPFGNIPLHSAITSRLDWEVELALVIGRAGVNIQEEDAMRHIYGYTVANDISARDLQQEHGAQWFKGKSLDGSCPLGPFLVTADEFFEPLELDLQCRVNGVIKQSSNTRHQAFGLRRLIAELSHGMSLFPGDIILTGTPEGIGNARKPPEYLQEGDIVESYVQGIGTMRNVIRNANF